MGILRHYWPEIKKYKYWLFAMLIGLLCTILADLALPFFVREIIDLIAQGYQGDSEQAWNIIKRIGVVFLVLGVAWRVNDYSIAGFEVRAMRDYYQRCFETVQKQSFQFFTDNFTGSLVKKVSRFVYAFETLVDVFYFNFLSQFLHIAFILIIFFRENVLLGFIFLAWAIFFLVINYAFAVWKMKYDKLAAQADSRVSGVLADSFGNYSTVKIFGKEKFENNLLKGVIGDWYQKTNFRWLLSNHVNFIQGVLMLSLEFGFYVLAIKWWQAGELTAGDFVFYQTYLMMTFHRLWDFGRNIRTFFTKLADAQEMVDILEKEVSVQDLPNAKKLDVKEGKIEFKNVCFDYRRQNSNDQSQSDTTIFNDLNLRINPGEKVAIVGHSGGGKSTLIKMLMRFYDVNLGKILVDGKNIREVTQESLHHCISLVPQDTDLFHRTIAENIAYGKNMATQQEIEQAAKKAHAHKFIQKFPKGYQTLVGERGIKLSGGEKQRIAIARVMLEGAKILVLDEATSSLDSVIEKEIQMAIENAMRGRTVIVIAHRLSTIKKVDRVIVIDEGEIVEEGKHEVLLKKKGKYSELWEHQVGGFI